MSCHILLYLAIFAIILQQAFIASTEVQQFAVNLTSENFDEAISKNNYFVKFFAPWCPYSKRIQPLWEELAKTMNSKDNPQVIIAQVDCTQQQELCARHKITGYPTLRLFKLDETESIKFTGTRDMPTITNFINEHVKAETEVPQTKGEVVVLNDANFVNSCQSGYQFVKFYAPWCPYSIRLAPTWAQLAMTVQDREDVTIAEVDCTANRQICEQFEVTGYPTLLWFKDGMKIEKYSGTRGHDQLQAYVIKMTNSN